MFGAECALDKRQYLVIGWSLLPRRVQGGIPCVCMRESQRSARYCGTCRKTVIGMDHHCVW